MSYNEALKVLWDLPARLCLNKLVLTILTECNEILVQYVQYTVSDGAKHKTTYCKSTLLMTWPVRKTPA